MHPKQDFSHLDAENHASMVDISDKKTTRRVARASCFVRMSSELIEKIRSRSLVKGDAFGVARIAAMQAAKRTSELIPLCHQVPLDRVAVSFELRDDGVSVESEAVATYTTGIEMEALTATSVAALTLYDMCKSVDRTMCIEGLRLEAKSGGKSGEYIRGAEK